MLLTGEFLSLDEREGGGALLNVASDDSEFVFLLEDPESPLKTSLPFCHWLLSGKQGQPLLVVIFIVIVAFDLTLDVLEFFEKTLHVQHV